MNKLFLSDITKPVRCSMMVIPLSKLGENTKIIIIFRAIHSIEWIDIGLVKININPSI